ATTTAAAATAAVAVDDKPADTTEKADAADPSAKAVAAKADDGEVAASGNDPANDDGPKIVHPEPSDPKTRSENERFIDQRPDDPGVRPGAEPAKSGGFRLFN
ncbi:MAG: hypothetical protein AAF737_09690, partial [Pseudomonadota bacterium]